MSVIKKTSNDNYFQKLIDLKLESISKIMSNEPTRNPTTTFRKNFNRRGYDDDRMIPTHSTNSFRRYTVSSNPRIIQHDNKLRNQQHMQYNRHQKLHLRPTINLNLSSDHRSVSSTNNSNNNNSSYRTGDSENSPEEIKDRVNSCSVSGFNLSDKFKIEDPDYKADIVSKLKSKAIGNLLFKAREDLNVKRLNEMKVKPEKLAEKALMLCDLKSYNQFVDELFSSGVFPVNKERTLDMDDKMKLNPEIKARKDVEDLERIIGQAFGKDFLQRNKYQEQFLK